MLTISKPLSAAQVRTYHAEEFSNARHNYYTQGDDIRGQWHGRARARSGACRATCRRCTSIGWPTAATRSPASRLVEHQTPRPRTPSAAMLGRRRMEHRAGWDATFSAPKSVSLTALVGGDARVAEAHRASVRWPWTKRSGTSRPGSGAIIPRRRPGSGSPPASSMTARGPVDGYAAPQLHTHVVFFNVTERSNGETRALQPQELYKTQQYGDGDLPLGTRRAPARPWATRSSEGPAGSRRFAATRRSTSRPRVPAANRFRTTSSSAQRSGAGAAQIARAPDARSQGRRLA